MPEGPEVENVRRGLAKVLCGNVFLNRAVRPKPEDRLRKPIPSMNVVRNQSLTRIKRRGKHLIFQFEKHCLISHLGMSGSWRISEKKVRQKHDLFSMGLLKDDKQLWAFYNDPRRFGSLTLVENTKEGLGSVLGKLGPEPNKRWTSQKLLSALTKGQIKNSLLDQSIICGIGNIYASEILFRSGIDPTTPSNLITPDEADRIVKVTIKLLALATKLGGSSISTYRNVKGQKGTAQSLHVVYGRAGKPCRRKGCEGLIESFKQGGRSTFWCPKCQTSNGFKL